MAKHNQIKYFDITAEAVLKLIIENTGFLPSDAEVIKVELNPPATYMHRDINKHAVRFIVGSENFQEVREGEQIKRMDLFIGDSKGA